MQHEIERERVGNEVVCARGEQGRRKKSKAKESMQINNYFIDHSIQRHLQRFDWIDEQKKAENDEGRRQVKAREEQTQIDTQREIQIT